MQYFLTKTLQPCENTQHIASLQLLCIHHMCFFLHAPCAVTDITLFRYMLLKTGLPKKLVDDFEVYANIFFDMSPFDIAAPIDRKHDNMHYARATVLKTSTYPNLMHHVIRGKILCTSRFMRSQKIEKEIILLPNHNMIRSNQHQTVGYFSRSFVHEKEIIYICTIVIFLKFLYFKFVINSLVICIL